MYSPEEKDAEQILDIELANQRIRELESELETFKSVSKKSSSSFSILPDENAIIKATVDSSIVPTFVLDREGQFILQNHAFSRHFLSSQSHSDGVALKAVFPEKVCDRIISLCAQILSGAPSNSFDWECETDLEPQIFNLSLFPIFDVEGARFAVGCVVVDITEKSLFENRLVESEARLRTMVEKTDNLVVQLDAGYCLTFANRAALDVYGLSSSIYVGLDTLGFIHVEDVDRVQRALDESISAGRGNLTIEYRFPPNRGDVDYLLWSFQFVYTDSMELMYINAIGRDISNRRNLELQLTRAKENAESADRSKSEFLAMISHEIRTPLNSIIGLSDLLKTSPMGEDEAMMLKTISSSGQSLLSLINDVLDLSQVESGHVTLDRRNVDIRDCMKQIENLFLFRANSKELDFELQVDASVPQIVVGDEDRILQVMNNLVGNAIKFTSEGYVKVRVRAEVLTNIEEFDFWSNDEDEGLRSYRLIIEVKDTGIGITPEQRVLLFQPFSQADPSIRRRFGGTGLGLVVSRKLAKLMDGDIDLVSDFGSGSCFKFTLKVDGQSEENSEPQGAVGLVDSDDASSPDTLAERCPLRIMVVDDVSQNRLVMSLLLERMGYNPIVLCGGIDALDHLEREEVDLLFLDMLMPEMSGAEVSREIRKREGTKRLKSRSIRIVALTANVMTQDRDECFNAGMDDFLGKPIRLSAIQSTIIATFELIKSRLEDELGLWSNADVIDK